MPARNLVLKLLFAGSVSGFLLLACTGKGVNTAPVFTPMSGTTTLTAAFTSNDMTVTAVKFLVDGQEVGTDSEAPDWSIDYDTRQLENGVHFVKAIANPGAGDIVLLDVAVFVNNPVLTPESSTPSP